MVTMCRAAVLEAQARGEKVTDMQLAYAHGCLWQVRSKDTKPYLLWIHQSLCCNIIRFRVLPMQAKRHGAMWSRGRHFRVAAIDGSRVTMDSGVSATFDQEVRVGTGTVERYTYYGIIDAILCVSYGPFDVYLFDVTWFQAERGGRQPSMKRGSNGFVTIDNRRKWTNKEDTLVYPYQCDQVRCCIWTISNV